MTRKKIPAKNFNQFFFCCLDNYSCVFFASDFIVTQTIQHTVTNFFITAQNKERFFFMCVTLVDFFVYDFRLRINTSFCSKFLCVIFLFCFTLLNQSKNKVTYHIRHSMYLPRICVLCAQFNEMVPRIVWPEQYVFCGLSRMILILSIFPSVDGDDWSVDEDDESLFESSAVFSLLLCSLILNKLLQI